MPRRLWGLQNLRGRSRFFEVLQVLCELTFSWCVTILEFSKRFSISFAHVISIRAACQGAISSPVLCSSWYNFLMVGGSVRYSSPLRNCPIAINYVILKMGLSNVLLERKPCRELEGGGPGQKSNSRAGTGVQIHVLGRSLKHALRFLNILFKLEFSFIWLIHCLVKLYCYAFLYWAGYCCVCMFARLIRPTLFCLLRRRRWRTDDQRFATSQHPLHSRHSNERVFLGFSARMTKLQFRRWLSVDWQRHNARIVSEWSRLVRQKL